MRVVSVFDDIYTFLFLNHSLRVDDHRSSKQHANKQQTNKATKYRKQTNKKHIWTINNACLYISYIIHASALFTLKSQQVKRWYGKCFLFFCFSTSFYLHLILHCSANDQYCLPTSPDDDVGSQLWFRVGEPVYYGFTSSWGTSMD